MIGEINSIIYSKFGLRRTHLPDQRQFAFVVLVAATALSAVAMIYRKLYQSGRLPFERWAVSLGISQQPGLTEDETKDLHKAARRYTPIEFVRRACSTESLKLQDLQEAKSILSSTHDRNFLTIEDEKAETILSWTMNLKPLFAVLYDTPLSWGGILQLIQSSPRLAYTILFNCMAPLVAQSVWENMSEFLPESLQLIGELHRKKIALVYLGLLVFLYYPMKQEKGILTNLTENFSRLHCVHKGLDLLPGYKESLKALLQCIGLTSTKDSGAHILWCYKSVNSTFVGEIGNILGEIGATGRMHSLFEGYSPLKNLQVFEFNVRVFLTEYRDKDAIYRGWRDIVDSLKKNENCLVVFTEIDQIKPYLLPKPLLHSQLEAEEGAFQEGQFSQSAEKFFSNLLIVDMQKGKFRCLVELDEKESQMIDGSSTLSRLFTKVSAPNLTMKDLEELCRRLCPSSEEINDLLQHMALALENTPHSPSRIMDTIQMAVRESAKSWRQRVSNEDEIREIEKAESELLEIQELKDKLLQQIWKEKALRQNDPKSLVEALLILEKVLLPIYQKNLAELKGKYTTPFNLLAGMQKQFNRLFGPCSKQEEERLKALPEILKTKIVGQDQAVDRICETILQWRRVPPLDGKPLVLFFGGPPGVGKSETATQIAYELNSIYGIAEAAAKTAEENVRRINLNRTQQGGLLGWEKVKGEILAHLLKQPASVIILEEWDKMTTDRGSLLELLDATNVRLGEPWGFSSDNGLFVDKSNAIFIFTSNTLDIDACFAEDEKGAAAFKSRLDATIRFENLPEEESKSLIEGYLDEYKKMGVLTEDRKREVSSKLASMELPTEARELQRLVRSEISKEIFAEPDGKQSSSSEK